MAATWIIVFDETALFGSAGWLAAGLTPLLSALGLESHVVVDGLSPPPAGDEAALLGALPAMLPSPVLASDSGGPRLSGGDADQIQVLLIGAAPEAATRSWLHVAGLHLRNDSGRLFPGRAVSLHALLYVPSRLDPASEGEVARFVRELEAVQLPPALFTTLQVVQDQQPRSALAAGLVHLDADRRRDLAVQLCAHLVEAGAPNVEHQLAGRAVGGVAAASVCLDSDAERRRHAAALGPVLLEELRRPSRTISAPDVPGRWRDTLGGPALVGRLGLAGHPPQFDFPSAAYLPRTADEPRRLVSPWNLFGRSLRAWYFGHYLRWLPFRLGETAAIFLGGRLDALRVLLRDRATQAWTDTKDQQPLREELRSAFASTLTDADARRGFLGLAEDAESIQAWLESDEAGLGADLDALEVFHVPEHLRRAYEDAPESLSPEAERDLHAKITDLVLSHPAPGALFVRAALLGLVLGVGAVPVASLAAPVFASARWLAERPVLTATCAVLLPLLAALWRYAIRTLRALQGAVRAYVAAVLRHGQRLSRDLVAVEIRRFQKEQVGGYCAEVAAWARKTAGALAYPPVHGSRFAPTPYQLELALPEPPVCGDHRRTELTPEDRWTLTTALLAGRHAEHQVDALLASAIPPAEEGRDGAFLGEACREHCERLCRGEGFPSLESALSPEDVRRLRESAAPAFALHQGAAQLGPAWRWAQPGRADLWSKVARAWPAAENVSPPLVARTDQHDWASLLCVRPLEGLVEVAVLHAASSARPLSGPMPASSVLVAALLDDGPRAQLLEGANGIDRWDADACRRVDRARAVFAQRSSAPAPVVSSGPAVGMD